MKKKLGFLDLSEKDFVVFDTEAEGINGDYGIVIDKEFTSKLAAVNFIKVLIANINQGR